MRKAGAGRRQQVNAIWRNPSSLHTVPWKAKSFSDGLFSSWAECVQSRELANGLEILGKGPGCGEQRKRAAESVSYMCRDQMRRQEGSQVDQICFPLWELISWLGEKKVSVEVLQHKAVSEKQMLPKEWLWAWQSLIWALRSTYSTSPSKLISFPGDYCSWLKGFNPVV